MADQPNHPQAKLDPSAIVTLALRFARKGVGPRPCSRWRVHDSQAWFPALPHRPRWFRLFATPAAWADRFLADPTRLGVADSSGIELRHPWRGSVPLGSLAASRSLISAGLSAPSWCTS